VSVRIWKPSFTEALTARRLTNLDSPATRQPNGLQRITTLPEKNYKPGNAPLAVDPDFVAEDADRGTSRPPAERKGGDH
jgi:hypothetical protein